MGASAEQTIYALSTAAGRAAIAVFRISGPGARGALETLIKAEAPPPRQGCARWLWSRDGERIDHALVMHFQAPHSFTGEDVAEISVHGGVAVIASVAETLASMPGLRVAKPGEFARRAFYNGKMDLTQAEGLADLIDSETELQRRQALRIAQGGLRDKVMEWRQATLAISGRLEAELDFSDEGDIGALASMDLMDAFDALRASLAEELVVGHRSVRMSGRFTVLLAGPTNVGKSTLFNALVGSNRAIVSATPGTTRDLIEVDLDIGGLPIKLIDSAGLRSTADKVEQEGIERAQLALQSSDLILWLNCAGLEEKPPPLARVIKLWTKADLAAAPDGWLEMEAGSPVSIGALITRLRDAAISSHGDGSLGLICRRRHIDLLEEAVSACHEASNELAAAGIELAAERCRVVLSCLAGLGGSSSVDDVLDEVFGRFCIGK